MILTLNQVLMQCVWLLFLRYDRESTLLSSPLVMNWRIGVQTLMFIQRHRVIIVVLFHFQSQIGQFLNHSCGILPLCVPYSLLAAV
jgi:hypothetical protein